MTRADGVQLSLNVRLRDDATLDNFLVADASAAAFVAIEAAAENSVFLHGPADGGKSHLLQAACHAAPAASLYLPLAELRTVSPDALLQDIESVGVICVDDLQLIARDGPWEQALFHLYNRVQASDCRLLFAADRPPSRLGFLLADLASRLAASLQFALPAADDARRRAILQFRAARRGLSLPDEVASYILNRADRSLTHLMDVLDELDGASLAAQRALSIPFVRQTLGW